MQSRTSSLSTPCQTCGCADTSCKDCQTPDNCSNCASCCCGVTHQSWRLARFQNGIIIEYISSIWMTIEVLGSIGLGLIAGSFSLLEFGGDSLVELISGIAVLTSIWKFSYSASNDNKRHTYTIS